MTGDMEIFYKKRRIILTAMILATSFLLLLSSFLNSEGYIANALTKLPSNVWKLPFTEWTPMDYKTKHKQFWYALNCFHGDRKQSISLLSANVAKWKQTEYEDCKRAYGIFMDIFAIYESFGRLQIPPEFKPKVLSWLGNNNELYQEVTEKQQTLHVRNLYTYEQTIYTPVRSKRPLPVATVDPREYVNNLANSTKESCDFCKYETNTAADYPFGRLKSELAATVSNTFKVNQWHTMVIPKTHHPINFTREQCLAVFDLAQQWIVKVKEVDATAKYPSLFWDFMPHGGASQIHPHLHIFFDPIQYLGPLERLRISAQAYWNVHKRNYFVDLIEVHSVLGLAKTYDNVTVLADLTGKKDNEIVIISQLPSAEVFTMFYYVFRAYVEQMSLFSFSIGAVLPEITSDPLPNAQMPVVIRISPRGDVTSMRSDASSFDLYGPNNLSEDPYKVFDIVTKYIESCLPER